MSRSKPLASARHKLYRTTVGQLLWATPVRPDICFAVKELSRSLQAPTQQDEKQLKPEAELHGMGMAVQDSLHLKSLLQEMQLSQLAKPFELTVYTDSSSGKALASKLGLTRKNKHVQLSYLFMKDLLACD